MATAKNLPADIQLAQQKIIEIKENIAAQQLEIKRLLDTIAQRMTEESSKKLAALEKSIPENFSGATAKIMSTAAENYKIYHEIQRFALADIERLPLTFRVLKKLQELNYHYVWEVAYGSWEYWRQKLKPADADVIRDALKDLNLVMGVDYIKILFETDPHYPFKS